MAGALECQHRATGEDGLVVGVGVEEDDGGHGAHTIPDQISRK